MKKLVTLILVLAISTVAHAANTITRDNISGFAELTPNTYNNDLNRVFDKVNSGIYGGGNNIVAGSITHDDMATNSKLSTYQNENLGDYVYSGLTLPSTGSATDAILSAGVCFVNGLRVEKAATTKTFGNTTTWVYIDQNGSYIYFEQTTQPTTPSNSIILGNVVASGGTISSADESYRATAPPNLRVYQDYRQGCIVSYDCVSGTSQFKVTAGEIDLGSASGAGLRRNTSATTVTWADIDTGVEASSTYYYVWAYPDAANAVNAAYKISTSTTGAAGVDNERLVGWFYNDGASNITPDSIGCYKGDGSGVPNICMTEGSSGAGITCNDVAYGNDWTNVMLRIYCSDRPILFTATAVVSSTAAIIGSAIFEIDGVDRGDSEVGLVTSAAAGEYYTFPIQWVEVLGEGTHTVKISGKVTANDMQLWKWRITAMEL